MSHAPAASTPRSRRRAKQREQILATGRRLVREGGLEALTIQRLARELDYTPGALYRYFPSKEALLAELQREALVAYRQLLRDCAARIDDELPQAVTSADRALVHLLCVGRLHRDLPDALPTEFRLLSGMLADPRPLVTDPTDVKGPGAALVDLLEAVVARCDDAAEVGALEPGDGIQRALGWVGATQGVLQLRKLARFDAGLFDAARLSDGLTLSLLRGWGASQASLQLAATHLDRITAGAPLASARQEPSA